MRRELFVFIFAQAFIFSLLTGCTHYRKPGVDFEETPPPRAADPYPNWPYPPVKAEAVLRDSPISGEKAKPAGKGTTGAETVDMHFQSIDGVLRVKWKAAPPQTLDSFNNSPRKELAAYEIQKLFLDPADYVVPTIAARCVPVQRIKRFYPQSEPSIPGTNCVLGTLALWLKDVKTPDSYAELYDEDRFRSDPVYAYFMSNINMNNYLIDQRDPTTDNFLVSKNNERRQVFAPDNGLSFGPSVFNPFLPAANRIRMPALRKSAVDRLRTVTRQDLDRLRVIAKFELDEDGVFQPVTPGKPWPGSRDKGIAKSQKSLQIGLTDKEIDGLYARIRNLVRWVDDGIVPTF